MILFLWAAWDCADELLALDDVAARLLTSDVSVVAVSIDREVANLKAVERSHAAWKLSHLHDPTGAVARSYDPSGFPAAYVIDDAGIIRAGYYNVRKRDLRRIETQAVEISGKSLQDRESLELR